MPTDNDIIEGTVLTTVVHEPKYNGRVQATVKARTDVELKRLANVVILDAGINRDTAWVAIVGYFMERVNRADVKAIIEAHLMNVKPKFNRAGNKFTFEFYDTELRTVDIFDVTLLEV